MREVYVPLHTFREDFLSQQKIIDILKFYQQLWIESMKVIFSCPVYTEEFQCYSACSHLSTTLDKNLKVDHVIDGAPVIFSPIFQNL